MRRSVISVLDHISPRLISYVAGSAVLTRLARPVVNRLVPTRHAVVTVKGGPAKGARLLIDPRLEKYYWSGLHEAHVQQLIAHLQPGDCFWDVGAHVGFMSCLAASRVGPSGSVFAFEPIPHNRQRLIANAGLNGADIQALAYAVSRDSGTMTIRSRGGSSLMWTLEQGIEDAESLTVPVTTLDAMLGAAEYPTLVKVDTEGVEVDVLRGAQRLLRDARTSFVVEFTDARRLDEGRSLAPQHRFTLLGDGHWLIAPK